MQLVVSALSCAAVGGVMPAPVLLDEAELAPELTVVEAEVPELAGDEADEVVPREPPVAPVLA